MMEQLFHISGMAAPAFLIGCIGGYPIGVRMIAQLYSDHTLDKKNAEQALVFCSNAGPAFCIGVIGSGILHSLAAGIILYSIHVLSALLTGFIYRPKCKPEYDNHFHDASNQSSFSEIITSAISSSGTVAMQVCTFILFFKLLISHILALTPSPIKTAPYYLFLGVLELAGGAALLSELTWSFSMFMIVFSLLIGFGGVCVYLQCISIIAPTGLSSKNMLKGKLTQAVISACLTAIVCACIPHDTLCFSAAEPAAFPIKLQAGIAALFALLVLLQKKSSGKRSKYRI